MYAYVINELSGKVTAFQYTDGQLKVIQNIEADSVRAQGSADIHISPDGKFLYASNRLKEDGIAIFSINGKDGTLTQKGYQHTGIHPRNFIITPNGRFLLVACRDSNVIQIYERDINTGLLTDTRKDIKLSKPVCIKFVE
jgi:6-phosphogluconolactonase (cycloisomerase 2 family)